MSDQVIEKANPVSRKSSEERARTVSVCIFFLVLIAAALLLQQIWWTILISIELMLVIGTVHSLGSNLPTRLRRQVKLNSRRADGSKSKRRSEIERDAVRRFKFDIMVCLAFALIPANVFVLVHLYFFPQLNRLKESIVLSPKQHWASIFLEPSIQLVILIAIMTALLYDSLKGIYLRRLKDLDDEISHRAEQYAIYDLVNPPKTSKRKTKKETSPPHKAELA